MTETGGARQSGCVYDERYIHYNNEPIKGLYKVRALGPGPSPVLILL